MFSRPRPQPNGPQTSAFAEWCTVTGWHGIQDFHNSRSLILKITWLLVVITGVLLAVNQCVSLLADYAFSDPWITSISFESSDNLDWPSLTVCGKVWPGLESFDADVPLDDLDAMQILLGRNDEEASKSVEHLRRIKNGSVSQDVEGVFAELATKFDAQDFDAIKFEAELCDRVVIHCGAIQGFKNLSKPQQCCGENNTIEATACFQLSTEAIFNNTGRVKRAGRSNGIYYLFQPELSDYFGNILFPGAGLEIEIHMNYSDPEARFDYGTGFALEPGTHNILAMALEKHRTVTRGRAIRFYNSKTDCDAYKTYSYTFVDESEYSTSLCDDDCIVQWQLKACKCYDVEGWGIPTKNLQKYRTCTKGEAKRCDQQFFDGLRKQKIGMVNEDHASYFDCVRQCPKLCDYERIDAKISSSRLIPPKKVKSYEKYLNKAFTRSKENWTNLTEGEVEQLILLEMYYEQRQVKVIERMTRLSIDELISSIGGCVGVWSGISILSIVQIVFYFFKGLCNFLCVPAREITGKVESQEKE